MNGELLSGRYLLQSEIGKGGMGVVYCARDTLLERQVAVKVLNAEVLGVARRTRLLHEARAAATLNHPNIVNVYDAGESQQASFIVMELVKGETLRQLSPPSVAEALTFVSQICAALAHAHAHGVIHCDLKLENAKLTPDGVVKLMDFGLAHSADRLTQEDNLQGTLTYLAPELITGGKPSPQSDLYALGVMLYELLSASPPFSSPDPVQLLGQHLHAHATPPSQRNPAVPPEVDALVARLLSKLPSERPASAQELLSLLGRLSLQPAAPDLPAHNLPAQLSSFIGREKELAQLQSRLEAHRLVTLTGSGGVGKTRLAIEAGRALLPAFPDGVWLVELAALADAALVDQTVATALGLKSEPGQPVLELLLERLSQKTTLIILDNCEHLVEASAQLAEALLRHCPAVRVCATSREALGIDGENIQRVPSLTLPTAELDNPAALLGYEAVRLFVERAQACLPEFELTVANASMVSRVCRRLDGIALAIELAASRVSALRVEQIAQRLDDAFRLLTGGSRTALPRHQTLRAAIDWSFTLLNPAERALFWRLAVFAGGWTLASAESVCVLDTPEGGRQFDVAAVLDLLTRLVDKSLVVLQRQPGAEARYHLLETVRQYAREKLLESGEGDSLRARHLEHFLELVVQAQVELHRREQKHWLARLESEHDNLRAALEWAIQTQSPSAARICAGLGEFWDIRGYLTEGRQWALRVLAEMQALLPTTDTIRVYYLVADIAARHTDAEEFLAYTEKGLELARQIGERAGIADGLLRLGIFQEYFQGQADEAAQYTAQALQIWRELGVPLRIAQALGPLAARALHARDYAGAEALYNESLAIFRDLGDQREIAGALWNLAEVCLAQEAYPRAQAFASDSLTLYRELGDKHGVATALRTLGQAIQTAARPADQEALFDESCRLFREINDRGCLGITLVVRSQAILDNGQPSQAKPVLREAILLAKAIGDPQMTIAVLSVTATLLRVQGDWRQSACLLSAAEACRQAYQSTLSDKQQSELQQAIQALRGQLEAPAFAQAWEEGRALSLEQAIQLALTATD